MSKSEFLSITERITVLPVIHGSGDFSVEVRDRLLRLEPDCIAVPIPPSFQEDVEQGVLDLPSVSIVAAEEPDLGPEMGGELGEEFGEEIGDEAPEWSPEQEGDEEAPWDAADEGSLLSFNYVPIDPCQPVIAALRTAMEERIHRAFVDMEVDHFIPESAVLPDPYALKKVPLEAFAASLLTVAPKPQPLGQREARIRWMAGELLRLEEEFERIVFVCSAMDWPWIRAACRKEPSEGREVLEQHVANASVIPRRYPVDSNTLAFVLGELPYITSLYEKRREDLRSDRNLAIDGVKELLLESREGWLEEYKPAMNWVTPQRLKIYFQYVRNLTLQSGRLTPDLFTLVIAAKQVAGDAFALTVAETARKYPYQEQDVVSDESIVRAGIGEAEFPDGQVGFVKSRLGGSEVSWRSISLKPKAKPFQKKEWKQRWNPFSHCSWPPEDVRIESFHTHVREQAKALLGQDLARSEKFTTSIKDGLDMRETLRNWHTGDLYVKEIPPARGTLEVVIFLFDTPADPEKYSWRTMWFAEHEEESTLCMYATPFQENVVGPGIAQSSYGGVFFVFPPRHIGDVWRDPRFHFAQTLEERLIAGACFHSQERVVALVSPRPPLARWRQIARLHHKHLVYLPLGRFSRETVERVRRFHVLNGRDVRSYAAKFIQDM